MNNYEKFKNIYEEIDDLINKQVTSSDGNFITWNTKTMRFLKDYYGDHNELKEFTETSFYSLVSFDMTTEEEHLMEVEACRSGLD